MDKNLYTKEMNDILDYVTSVLYKEFPIKKITIEYIITAFLENKNSHANTLLDCFIVSNSMNQLLNIFTNYLREHAMQIGTFNNLKDVLFDEQCETILKNAETERKEDKPIGSEHVLLSMINPKNKCQKIIDIFSSFGIDYDLLLPKCENTSWNDKPKATAEKPKSVGNNLSKLPNNSSQFIQKYTTNIVQEALDGKYDKLIGRENEINTIIEVLARRKKNNVVLVGLGGVGKTSIVQEIARRIGMDDVPDFLKNKKIIQLDSASLISGTYLRGAFEERVNGIINEMKNSNKYILFIDDIHNVLKTSSRDKDGDISSMMNDMLSNGSIRVIGTTSYNGYRNCIDSNPMLSRRLQKVVVEPMTTNETVNILDGIKDTYERYHNVRYSSAILDKCVELANRYVTDRSLPDSAIDILDFAGALASLKIEKPQNIVDCEKELQNLMADKQEFSKKGEFSQVDRCIQKELELKSIIADFNRDRSKNAEKYANEVTTDNVFKAVSEMTNIPIKQIGFNEKERLSKINDVLKQSIIGQDEAIDVICKSIKRNKIGLGNPNKVIFSGLLVGKSGTGKTALAKKLAEQIYGDEKALIRIDMSEYSDKMSVSKLIGASVGYIGYEQGGLLTEAVKNKPYCVLLLDEIEKADKEIYNVFLQLLDEGRLTDNTGQLINFKNVIVLMTSNIGVKRAEDFGNGIGFNADKSKTSKSVIEKEIKNKFMPEFLNRLDQIVFFNDLSDDSIRQISRIELEKVITRLKNLGYGITYDESVVELIAQECLKERNYGARPILRYIQTNVEDNITSIILSNENARNFYLQVQDDNIAIQCLA